MDSLNLNLNATMNNDGPLISICIPTYRRGPILQEVLESIFTQLDNENLDKVEVVVADNDPDLDDERYVEKFIGFKNFRYHRNNSLGCQNFLRKR